MATLTNDRSKKSPPATSPDSLNATGSPESAAGVSPCESPALLTIHRAGQDHRPASLSASPESKPDLTTHDTLPPSGCGLLTSAGLQECLANRLRQRLSPDGLIFYSAKWKERATPAGRQYCQLVLSKRPTCATDYFSGQCETWTTPSHSDGTRGGTGITENMTGSSLAQQAKLAQWATPIANDAKGSDYSKSGETLLLKLPGQAKLAAWPTARAVDGEKNARTLDGALSEVKRKGGPQDLPTAAKLASWPTASATDHKGGYEGGRIRNGKLSVDRLDVAAQLATWPTPLTVPESDASRGQLSGSMRQQLEPCKPSIPGLVLNASGIDVTGSYAETATTGPLNPALSRWLMGYPPEWDACAVMAMPSRRKSQQSLSKPSTAPLSTPAVVKARIRAYSFEYDGWLSLAAKVGKQVCG